MQRLTQALPGTGGLFKATPEDFFVEEQPAYLPSGEGTHTFLFIEKRGLNTEEALQRLCRALGVARDAAGAAGMKDRQAVTRQWVSLPGVDPEAAKAVSIEGVTVLQAARHGNKLRTGHLRGNRFRVTVRGLSCPMDDAISRAHAIIEALMATGLPNRFGAQRFGARGDNAARGRELIIAGEGARRMPKGERRLLISAFQSELFNQCLEARIADGLLRTAIAGDMLKKRDTGGMFVCEDLADGQARLDAGTLDITGPMFGSRMIGPPPGSAANDRETAILTASGVTPAHFAKLGSLAEGTRRPYTVPIEAPEITAEADALTLSFALPSGSYATVLIDEVMKSQ
jgi:tRNA pseudouridine13 synthase